MKEQKFSALDSFADRYEITFEMSKGSYRIWILQYGYEVWSGGFEDADTALTAALRYLRKINKAPKP